MNDAEFQKLLNAEPPVILKAKPLDWIIFSLIFGGAGYWLAVTPITAPNPQRIAMISWIMFGILFLGFLYLVSAVIIINHQKFLVRALWLFKYNYSWKDVSEFTLYGAIGRGVKSIIFDYNGKGQRLRMPGLDMGYEVTIQLAALMNHWRERALTAESSLRGGA